MKRTALWTLFVVFVTAAAWGQEDPVLLRYKYAPGQVLRTIEVTRGTIPMSVAIEMPEDMPAADAQQRGGSYQISTAVDATVTTVMTVDSVDPDGTAHARLSIEYMLTDSNTTLGDQVINTRVEYDDGEINVSGDTDGQVPQQQLAKFREMLEREYSILMDPLGGVEAIDSEYEKIYGQIFGSQLMGADLREFTRATGGLPANPVHVGDTWEGDYDSGRQEGQTTGHSEMALVDLTTAGDTRTAKIAGTSTINIKNAQEISPATPPMGAMMGLEGMRTSIDEMTIDTNFEMLMDVGAGVMSQTAADVTFQMVQTVTMDLAEMLEDRPMEMTITNTVEEARLHIERSTISSVQEG